VTRWQHGPGVVWRRSGDKIVVLAPGSDELLVLSGTGAVTWQLLADPVEEHELVALLAEGFEVDPGEVGATVVPFLAGLADAGVVRLS
jgi:hypothetical protein